MEGFLLVPPDRTALIGRPVWKPRYIAFGLAGTQPEKTTSSQQKSQSGSKKSSILKSSSSKPSLISTSSADKDDFVLSIYKQKGDHEPIQQHPLSRLKALDIQTMQHPKKTGPAIPTLIINLEVDAAAEKLRKRRSSRTGGLTSSSPSNVIYFRSLDNERYNIYDWQMAIQPMLQRRFEEEGPEVGHDDFDGEKQRRRKTNPSMPMSPLSPIFSQFANPFQRPTTSSGHRPNMPQARGSDHTFSSMQSSRDRQAQMVSPEPSLRSRRSDLSSQASSQQKPFGSTHYSSTLPSTASDLPSPNSAYEATEQEGLEGWTMAQSRRCGSALSSHTRNSNSINTPPIISNANMASSPIPRETILDRAFQMRYIPGSEKMTPSSTSSEKELSSIARFEALMRKVDEEKARERELQKSQNQKSGWELDEESEEDSDMDEGPLGKGDKKNADEDVDPLTVPPEAEIPRPAQRALDYISGRIQTNLSHSPHASISPLSPPPPSQHYRDRPYSTSTRARTGTISSVTNDTAPHLEGVRFQDSFDTASGRPSISRQDSIQSKHSGHGRTRANRPTSLALPSRPKGSADVEFSGPFTAAIGVSMERERDAQRIGMERSHTTGNANRLSTSSIVPGQTQTGQEKKRLSFTEFTRRLSSTSSLLLVQTNTNLSSSSGRVSSESSGWIDTSAAANDDMRTGGLRHSTIGGIPRDAGYGYARDGLNSRDGERGMSRDEKRCGWRGSVGVFGGEGGFL